MAIPLILRPIFAIALGAIAGALSRYAVGLGMAQWLGTDFPFGTLLVNGTGCLGMGLFIPVANQVRIPMPAEVRLGVLTGFLGSYTTFSSYGLESLQLLQQSRPGTALLYGLGSIVLGLFSLQLGMNLATWALHQWERRQSP